jgi:predicted aspartyl protease
VLLAVVPAAAQQAATPMFKPAPVVAQPKASAELAAAQQLYADGKFAQAQDAAQKLSDGDKYSVAGLQLRARLELSANNVSAAQADLLQARRLDLHNRTTLQLLALAFTRADRFADAAPFLEQVDKVAEARQAQALAGTEAYHIEGLGLEDRIRLIRVDPLPVVAVRLNGGDVMYFLVDTGGPEVLLDSSLADKLDLKDMGATEGTFAGGTQQSIGHSVLPSLAIGLWVVHNVPVILKSTEPYKAAGGGLDIRGVIGTEFLAQFVSTLDYRNNELILRRKPGAPGAETSAQLAQRMTAAAAQAVPMHWVGDHYLLAEGTVNGAGPMQFFVDTGLAGFGFTAPDSTLKAAGIPRDAQPVQPITVKTLTLGPITEHDVAGLAGPFPPSLQHSTGVQIGGIVSHTFFRAFAVTFDFGNMTLWLQR